jgi:hypothetical protein
MKNLIPISGGAGDSQRANPQTPELDVLFQASRQVEAALLRERAETERLKTELKALQERHAQDLARARQHIQQLHSRDEEFRKRLEQANAKIQHNANHARRLQEANERLRADLHEQARKAQLELTAARSAADHIRNRAHELEQTVAQLKPQLDRTEAELDRTQADILEREHRFQAALLGHQGRDRSQQETIEALKDQLRRLQAEVGHQKSRWLESERARQEAEQTHRRGDSGGDGPTAKELAEANQSLSQRLAIEKRRREQSDSSARAAEQEREMLLSKIQTLEERLSFAEEQLARASAEASLRKYRHESAPAPRTHRAARTPAPQPAIDFEALEKLALLGFPVKD